MRITTKLVLDMETLEVLDHQSYEYSGPVDLCGGGKSAMRNLTQQQAQTNATNSAADRATQLDATGKVRGVADQLMSTKAGSLSPWSSANYASNLDNIAKTYGDLRTSGFKALSQSGFGTSPGAIASVMNTANENQGKAQTSAYRGALQDTLDQTVQGANMEQGVSGQFGAQSQNESAQSVADAKARIDMGSTFGDVMGGIGAIAPYAAAPFTGGASLGLAGVKKPGATPSYTPPTSTYNPNARNNVGFYNINKPSYSQTGVGRY